VEIFIFLSKCKLYGFLNLKHGFRLVHGKRLHGRVVMPMLAANRTSFFDLFRSCGMLRILPPPSHTRRLFGDAVEGVVCRRKCSHMLGTVLREAKTLVAKSLLCAPCPRLWYVCAASRPPGILEWAAVGSRSDAIHTRLQLTSVSETRKRGRQTFWKVARSIHIGVQCKTSLTPAAIHVSRVPPNQVPRTGLAVGLV
jgi:hypothetical protein